MLPRTFDGVFGDYNALQKQQGFDLSIYAGETCSVYTYRVMNYAGTSDTVLAQLFVYRNRVIGGDICSADTSGKTSEPRAIRPWLCLFVLWEAQLQTAGHAA